MNWNDCYAELNTPWEKGFATPVLREIAQRHGELFKGRALVPGCGVGHDARGLAKLGMNVVGADIAPLAVERAKAWDVKSPVEFVLADVFVPPAEWVGAFDMVWEHTCFCALPLEMREDYVASMVSMLKPGGLVAGVFFINPEMDEGEEGPPFGIEVETLLKMWNAAGMEVADYWVPKTGYEGRVGRELAAVIRKG